MSAPVTKSYDGEKAWSPINHPILSATSRVIFTHYFLAESRYAFFTMPGSLFSDCVFKFRYVCCVLTHSKKQSGTLRYIYICLNILRSPIIIRRPELFVYIGYYSFHHCPPFVLKRQPSETGLPSCIFPMKRPKKKPLICILVLSILLIS
jgi:hypothetical protein